MKKVLLMVVLSLVPFSASAQVMQYSLCKLKDGKTITDAQNWLTSWRQLMKQSGKKYDGRILIPHASPESADQFFFEGSTATFTTYADAWEWWYADAQAKKSSELIRSIAVCGQDAIYVSTD